MEILLLLAGIALAASILYSVRQNRRLAERDQVAHSRDQEIRKLRAQLANIEQQSSESKALVSTISSVAFDLVILLDEDLTVITYNQSAERFFRDLNPIGEPLQAAIDSPDLLNLVQLALSEDESLEEQFVVDKTYYRARTQVLNNEGDRRYVGIAMQDITDLVTLNRARRDMVANISHELRTPITRIRLIIERFVPGRGQTETQSEHPIAQRNRDGD